MLRLAHVGDPEPGPRVVLPPGGSGACLGVGYEVKFERRSGCGEHLVKFEDAVVAGAVMAECVHVRRLQEDLARSERGKARPPQDQRGDFVDQVRPDLAH